MAAGIDPSLAESGRRHKKCPSEAVARAGENEQFAAAFKTGFDVDKVN